MLRRNIVWLEHLLIKLPFDRLVRKQRVRTNSKIVSILSERRNAACTDFRFSRYFWKTKLDDRRAERNNRAFENRDAEKEKRSIDRSIKRGRNRAVAEERRNRTRHETRSPLRSIGFLISAANAHVHRWMNRCCWSNATYAPCQNVQTILRTPLAIPARNTADATNLK